MAMLAVAVVLLLTDKFVLRERAAQVAGASEKSIAVLPFENLSRDPENAYFADGIQDEILSTLGKINDLRVISRTSTAKYKSRPDNLRQVATELDAATILEGSVQRAADQVRVIVQLIDAANRRAISGLIPTTANSRTFSASKARLPKRLLPRSRRSFLRATNSR